MSAGSRVPSCGWIRGVLVRAHPSINPYMHYAYVTDGRAWSISVWSRMLRIGKPKTKISLHAAWPTASHLIRRRRKDKLLNFRRLYGRAELPWKMVAWWNPWGLFVWAAAFEKQLQLVGCGKAAVENSCWKQRFDVWQECFLHLLLLVLGVKCLECP
jgi:hypothetical protein